MTRNSTSGFGFLRVRFKKLEVYDVGVVTVAGVEDDWGGDDDDDNCCCADADGVVVLGA